MKASSKLSDKVPLILTPGLMARHCSGGRWKMARHLSAIDAMVTDLIRRQTDSILLIEAPPQHGKSEFISRYLPAWYLGRYPDRRVILCSYEANFARSWGRKARDVLTEYGQDLFGVRVSQAQSAAVDWEIEGTGGGMVTAGVGGPITGRGAHLLIIDDYIKNSEQAVSEAIRENQWDWFGSTALTRCEPGSLVIVMATRWHKDDISGRIIRMAESGDGPPVYRLRLPAIAGERDQIGRRPGEALWPERWSVEKLESKRSSMERYWWNALFQQDPTRHGRTEWPDSYFGPSIWAASLPETWESRVVAVDPSKGRDSKRGDFSAIVEARLVGGMVYVDAVVERLHPTAIVARTVEMATCGGAWCDAVGVEANQFQELLAPEFDRHCEALRIPPLPLHLITNTVAKELRIGRLGPHLDRGKLRFADTPGARLLVKQLEEFPLGDHDDGPDALEMSLRLLQHTAAANSQQEIAEYAIV